MGPAARAEHVGSFVMPSELRAAIRAFEQGRMAADELREAADAAVLRILGAQRDSGIELLTDGEYRRQSRHLALSAVIEGLIMPQAEVAAAAQIYRAPHDLVAEPPLPQIGGKLVARDRLF